jgi:hypothetical protein
MMKLEQTRTETKHYTWTVSWTTEAEMFLHAAHFVDSFMMMMMTTTITVSNF